MPLTTPTAVNLFIGVTLTLMVLVILGAARRRTEHLVLAMFLALVSINFVTVGLFEQTGVIALAQISVVAVALDPFFLLFFVTIYPFRRTGPVPRALLVVTGAFAAIGVAGTILQPERTLSAWGTTPADWTIWPWGAVTRLNLAFAYAAAWLLAARAAGIAPTPTLQRRAGWVMAAIGVAVLPRLAAEWQGFGIPMGWPWTISNTPPWDGLLPNLYGAGFVFVVGAAAMLLGFALLRDATGRIPRPLRGPVTLVAVALPVIVLAQPAYATALYFFPLPYLVPLISSSVRWLIFAAILVHGALAYELVDFRRARERILPLAGGGAGATAGYLAMFVYASGHDALAGLVLPLSAMAAMAAAWPSTWLTRRVLRGAGPTDAGADRRLELYRASLEAAHAAGPLSQAAKAQLAADRKAFGVSQEEARALEHVVAMEVAPRRAVRVGEEVLPGIEIERELGSGAQGRAFLARDHATGKRVVVKELLGEGSAETRKSFLTEVRSLQRLSHPGIVRLLDAQVREGRMLLVTEYAEGETLAQRLTRGPLRDDEARDVLGKVLDALAAAHAERIVHRDVKPANILVESDGAVKLLDFGISAAVSGAAARATITNLDKHGDVVGSLAYMAPEQAKGGRVGPWTDTYAVGLVAVETLTGRPALDLKGREFFASLERIAAGDVDLATVPEPWKDVLGRALERDPTKRFATAADMRAALPPGRPGAKGALRSGRPAGSAPP